MKPKVAVIGANFISWQHKLMYKAVPVLIIFAVLSTAVTGCRCSKPEEAATDYAGRPVDWPAIKAAMDAITKPNARHFKKGYIVLDGFIRSSGQVQYVRVRIGTPKDFINDNLPEIYINLKNGKRILLSDISFDMLRAGQSFSDSSDEQWSKDTSFYYMIDDPNSYRFAAIENKFIAIEISDWSREGVVIWDKSLKPHTFPLSTADAVELFGTPDEIIDYISY